MATADSTVTYKEVPGFPGYRAGDDGTVWRQWVTCRAGRKRTDRWRQMKLSPGTRGYLRVNLVPPGGGTYRTFRVHHLILLAFAGECPEGMECRHLNGIKTDNRLDNICWGTPADNYADRKKHANHGPNIRLYTRDGRTMPLKDWARHFNIPYNTLWQRINTLGMTFEEAVTRPPPRGRLQRRTLDESQADG